MAQWQRTNQLSRPYDVAIPAPLLAKIEARRFSPDGLMHNVPVTKRGGKRAYKYPFRKMELGDFFIVPLDGRSEGSMRTAFYQAAARLDLEIAIKPWKLEGGVPGLRVTVVIIGVNGYKRKAEDFGVKSRYSDGKWKARRRVWERDNRPSRPGRSRQKENDTPFRREPPDKHTNPFWADAEDHQPLAIDVAIANANTSQLLSEPTETLTREERLKRALAAAGED